MASALNKAQMTVEHNGMKYYFPNVDIEVKPIASDPEGYDDGFVRYYAPAVCKALRIEGHAYRDDEVDYIMLATKEEEIACEIPELYEDDLIKITDAMGILDGLSRTGVFSCEIRIKTDDLDTWVVIGYGEDAEPAILRFECDL